MREIPAQRLDDRYGERHQLAFASTLAPNPCRAPCEVGLLEVQPAQLRDAQAEGVERHNDRRVARLRLRLASRRRDHPPDVLDGRPAGVAPTFGLHAWDL